MATTKTIVNPEFLYIPVGNIVVLEQVRSNINSETDSFKSLMQSIKDKGILEPLLVTGPDGISYTLLCGERRLAAARQLGLESVPVRVIEAGKELGETIAFQLTENLQREDLNPMDQAKGILAFIQARHPDKGYDVNGVINELMNYNLKPDSVLKEVTDTLSVIAEISGKSTRTLLRTISLLKNPPETQTAIREGNLPVSQGYLFAANLDCPDLMKAVKGENNKGSRSQGFKGEGEAMKAVKGERKRGRLKERGELYRPVRLLWVKISCISIRFAGK